MRVIGVDPDSKDTSWCCMEDGEVLSLGVVSIPRKFRGADSVREMIWALQDLPNQVPCGKEFLLVVEGQQAYQGRGRADPNSLIMIAQVTGAVAGILRPFAGSLVIPRPCDWKKSVPKPIHQARILSRIGWEYTKTSTGSYPTNAPFDFKVGEWLHLVDSIGLAAWGEARG